MIAVDTSTLIIFLEEDPGLRENSSEDCKKLRRALLDEALFLPPPVLTELLSIPSAPVNVRALWSGTPLLAITDGYWERAGASRAKVISLGLKAKLADALIAQACIDADVPLITRDRDFRHFAQHCGLKLA